MSQTIPDLSSQAYSSTMLHPLFQDHNFIEHPEIKQLVFHLMRNEDADPTPPGGLNGRRVCNEASCIIVDLVRAIHVFVQKLWHMFWMNCSADYCNRFERAAALITLADRQNQDAFNEQHTVHFEETSGLSVLEVKEEDDSLQQSPEGFLGGDVEDKQDISAHQEVLLHTTVKVSTHTEEFFHNTSNSCSMEENRWLRMEMEQPSHSIGQEGNDPDSAMTAFQGEEHSFSLFAEEGASTISFDNIVALQDETASEEGDEESLCREDAAEITVAIPMSPEGTGGNVVDQEDPIERKIEANQISPELVTVIEHVSSEAHSAYTVQPSLPLVTEEASVETAATVATYCVSIETHSVSVIAESFPVQLSPQHQMLHDLREHTHPENAQIWEILFEKFPEEVVKSWKLQQDRRFELVLKKPISLWVPDQEYTGGAEVLFGVNTHGIIRGFLINGNLSNQQQAMLKSVCNGKHFKGIMSQRCATTGMVFEKNTEGYSGVQTYCYYGIMLWPQAQTEHLLRIGETEPGKMNIVLSGSFMGQQEGRPKSIDTFRKDWLREGKIIPDHIKYKDYLVARTKGKTHEMILQAHQRH